MTNKNKQLDKMLDVQLKTPMFDETKINQRELRTLKWFEHSFYLDLGPRCNQHCRYCFQQKHEAGFYDFEVLKTQIELAKSLNMKRVILIGGEPLICPDLDLILNTLAQNKITKWGVMTNGIKLADADFLDSLVKRGLGFLQISFDSPYAAVQNKLSRNSNLFETLLKAIKNLSKHKQLGINFNAVILRDNIDDLSKLVELVDSFRVKYALDPSLTFTHMKPSDKGDNALMVKAHVAALAIKRAIDLGISLDLPVRFRNLPFCLLEGYEHFSSDWVTRHYIMQKDGTLFEPPEQETGKLESCDDCAYIKTCPGFSLAYAKQFGTDEFAVKVGANNKEKSKIIISNKHETIKTEPQKKHDLRISIGDFVDGQYIYYDIAQIKDKLPASENPDKLVLTGPETVLHPKLPEIIKLLAGLGFNVYLESTCVFFVHFHLLKKLVSSGLKGIIWLVLPAQTKAIKRLLPAQDFSKLSRLIIKNLDQSRVSYEIAFLVSDELTEKLQSRIERISELCRHKPTIYASCLPYLESWHIWFGLAKPDISRLEQIERELTSSFTVKNLGLAGFRRFKNTKLRQQSTASNEHYDDDFTISILLGTKCNLRCEFCYIEDHSHSLSKDAALDTVDQLLLTGCKNFLIAGGEPTLFEFLPDVLDKIFRAKASATLVSNGYKLSDMDYLKHLHKLGLRKVLLSFHSHKKDVHAHLTGSNKNLANLLIAHKNLVSLGIEFYIHHVLYAGNYRDFPGFVEFYAKHLRVQNQTKLSISNVLLVNQDFKKQTSSIQKFSDLLPYYNKAVDIARSHGFMINHGHSADALPECIFSAGVTASNLPPQKRMIRKAAENLPGIIFAARDELSNKLKTKGLADYNKLFQKSKKCKLCSRKNYCLGVQRDYLALFWDSEIRPIK